MLEHADCERRRVQVSRAVVSMLLTFIAGRNCQGINTAHVDDPELVVTWTPPADVRKFTEKREEAYYSGLLWAGKDEFNWIVDVRSEDDDQENWAVGNLVSSFHVLTTCTAVDRLNAKSNSCELRNHTQIKEFSIDEYHPNCGIRIYYCQDFLWKDGRHDSVYLPDTDLSVTGWRSPDKLLRHASCHNTLTLILYDAAIIWVNKPIPPFPPRLGYMPLGYNYATEEVEQTVDLDPKKPITHQTPFCYVASFGRNPVNFQERYVLDYKVKYRVYITPWQDCLDRWQYICNDEPGCDHEGKYDGIHKIWCFRPRSKIGTVCAHDRGAPVVCNGQAVGLVSRGPDFRYCNNMYKIPFVVENIYNYRHFLADSVHSAVSPPQMPSSRLPSPMKTKAKSESLIVVRISPSCLWLCCWALTMRYS